MTNHIIPEYGWEKRENSCAHSYLLSGMEKALNDWRLSSEIPQSTQLHLFDAGCGNGSLSYALNKTGYDVAGCDQSEEGVSLAKGLLPNSKFEALSVYENMADVFGQETWDIVISSEVIEHLYDPGKMVRNVLAMLRPGGLFLITTPYHGYLKNLLMALTGKTDKHFTALWDGGHIKFWSYNTLSSLLRENGFTVIKFSGAGRLPWLWKSMIISARKDR